MKWLFGDRRKQPRHDVFKLVCVRIVEKSWVDEPWIFIAKLLDVSAGGLGVEISSDLPIGSSLSLAFEIECDDFCLEVEGSARVRYCVPFGTDHFRLGLAYESLRWRSAGSNSLAVTLQIIMQRADNMGSFPALG